MSIDEALTILDAVLHPAHLTDIQEAVFCEAWVGKTFPAIAADLNFTEEYIRAVGADLWHLLSETLGEKVTKRNVRSVIERRARQQPVHRGRQVAPALHDWGDAVDVSMFLGRTDELAVLTQWIVTDRCRLVALLGMGGMGKTSLSVKLGQHIQSEFECLVWRSLRNAPPLSELLASLLRFLTQEAEPDSPATVSEQLSRLMQHLRDRRCLVILDNAEMILRGSDAATSHSLAGSYAGQYRDGYEAYGELLLRIGEVPHQSCLILTSREKPREIDVQEGEREPVRSLHLRGLTALEGQELFKLRGRFTASGPEWQRLVRHYAGNPLALKIVASIVQDLFDSDISRFLDLLCQGMLVFDDIRDLLSRQFDRLSEDEKSVMYWLAIHREHVSFAELQAELVAVSAKAKLPEVLKSLGRRFLIERSAKGFTQQPVVMEFVIDRFLDQVCQELCTGQIGLLMSHCFIKAQAKSYVRESQVRMILQPIGDRLCDLLTSLRQVELKLQHLLRRLRAEFAHVPGYAGGNLINLLHQLNIDITGYDFSQLAVWQAALAGVTLHGVNFANADLSHSTFTEVLGNIWTVACSLDGQHLAAGDTINTIHVWQIAEVQAARNRADAAIDERPTLPVGIAPQKRLACVGHTNWVTCLGFSSNSQMLASGSADTTLKLWDVATGQCLHTLSEHRDWVLSVAFDSNDTLLATSSADRTIKLWDTATGNCLQTLQGHTNWVRGVLFLPKHLCGADPAGAPLLISGSSDDTIKLWDPHTGACLRTWTVASQGVWAIALSPDGHLLATGGTDATVKLWHMPTGLLSHTLKGHMKQVRSLVFSPDGQRIISASEDQTIRIWDTTSGECRHLLHEHTSAVWSVAGSTYHRFASGSLDQRVKLWDLRNGRCLSTLQGYTAFVWATAIAPQRPVRSTSASDRGTALLASGTTDHTIKLWNLQTGKCVKTLCGHANWVLSVAFRGDGQMLASSSFDHTIRLWDIASTRCLQILRGHTNWVVSVQFSPEGTTLASSSFDQTIKLWDVQTGECLKTLTGHEARLWSIAFSPDGKWLASGGDDETVRLWSVETGACLRVLTGHDRRIWSVAFSLDGAVLASAGRDRTIRIWDPTTGECLRVLTGHTERIQSIAFSLDGNLLASGSADHTIKLWNWQTGKCIKTLAGHSNRVWSVAFGWLDAATPQQILASGSEDETIRVWDLEQGKCLQILQGPRPYQGTNIAGVTGLTEAQKSTLKALGAVEVVYPLQ